MTEWPRRMIGNHVYPQGYRGFESLFRRWGAALPIGGE